MEGAKARMGKEIHIDLAWAAAPRRVELVSDWVLPQGSRVGQALLGIRSAYPAWFAESGAVVTETGSDSASEGRAVFAQLARVGVWGKVVTEDHVLRQGDRLELYRPLRVDPKEARRLRFQSQGAKTAGLFAKRRAKGAG